MRKKFQDSGGLWIREKTVQGAPMWQGHYECGGCGKKHQLLGWNKHQMGHKAKDGTPNIIIKGGMK